MNTSISLVTVVALTTISCAASVEPPPEDLLAGPPSGPWRRLFLDAMVVEGQQGLERVFHAVQKCEENPVIRRDRPWDKAGVYPGPNIYGTVMWDDGKLRMWYRCYTPTPFVCYAESRDGIQWAKPNLGIYPWRGSKENNIVMGVSQNPDEKPSYRGAGQCNFPLVFKRPQEDEPGKRYVMFCYGIDYRTHRAAYSPDGLHWTFVAETAKKGIIGAGDASNYSYDPYLKRYFAMRKMASRGLAGRQGGRGRAMGIAWSEPGDELKWTVPVAAPVMAADDLDPDATQIYGMAVFPYQGLYIGTAWVYHARWFKYGKYAPKRMRDVEKGSPCTTDVQLAWSWDLINWTRTSKREPFIPLGPEGAFDGGAIQTARAPVQVGDQLYFYYTGNEGRYKKPSNHSIGLATLRLDGFCSMQAGDEEGWLITRREVLRKPQVTINARTTSTGGVVAEILDRENKVLTGFSREECIPFAGDSVRHVMKWRADRFLGSQMEGDKKLRFILKNAQLFSYIPVDA